MHLGSLSGRRSRSSMADRHGTSTQRTRQAREAARSDRVENIGLKATASSELQRAPPSQPEAPDILAVVGSLDIAVSSFESAAYIGFANPMWFALSGVLAPRRST